MGIEVVCVRRGGWDVVRSFRLGTFGGRQGNPGGDRRLYKGKYYQQLQHTPANKRKKRKIKKSKGYKETSKDGQETLRRPFSLSRTKKVRITWRGRGKVAEVSASGSHGYFSGRLACSAGNPRLCQPCIHWFPAPTLQTFADRSGQGFPSRPSPQHGFLRASIPELTSFLQLLEIHLLMILHAPWNLVKASILIFSPPQHLNTSQRSHNIPTSGCPGPSIHLDKRPVERGKTK